jgi:Gluconate 2-dehydrogenase subunit 3
MPIKRRGFVQTLLLAPAATAALAGQQQAPAQPTTPQSAPPRNAQPIANPVRPGPPPPPATLKLTEPDLTAETQLHFFTAAQFAVLQKLGAVLVPPIKGNPGAMEAHAPEFLDFFISASLPETQKLYRDGLDQLNVLAHGKYNKAFSDLESADAGAILKPLITVRLWSLDQPSDPLKHFITQVHDDLRTATRNSREYAAAAASSGRRFTRGGGASGLYLAPVDPLVD